MSQRKEANKTALRAQMVILVNAASIFTISPNNKSTILNGIKQGASDQEKQEALTAINAISTKSIKETLLRNFTAITGVSAQSRMSATGPASPAPSAAVPPMSASITPSLGAGGGGGGSASSAAVPSMGAPVSLLAAAGGGGGGSASSAAVPPMGAPITPSLGAGGSAGAAAAGGVATGPNIALPPTDADLHVAGGMLRNYIISTARIPAVHIEDIVYAVENNMRVNFDRIIRDNITKPIPANIDDIVVTLWDSITNYITRVNTAAAASGAGAGAPPPMPVLPTREQEQAVNDALLALQGIKRVMNAAITAAGGTPQFGGARTKSRSRKHSGNRRKTQRRK